MKLRPLTNLIILLLLLLPVKVLGLPEVAGLMISSVSPFAGQTNVPVKINEGAKIVFANSSLNINESSLENNIIILSSDSSEKMFAKNFQTHNSQDPIIDTVVNFYFGRAGDASSLNCQLKNNTTYTVTLKGGSSGIKGIADGYSQIMASDYSWSFTTGDDTFSPDVKILSGKNQPNVNALFSFETDEPTNYEINYGYAGGTQAKFSSNNFKSRHDFYMPVLMVGKNYNLKLTAKDRQGNTKEVDFIIEVLNISNVSIKIGEKSAQITWQTSRPTATAIEYGVSTKYEIKKNINESRTSHQLALNDLLLGQNKYHFRIKAEEKSGISYSIDYDFQTLANNPTYYNDEGFWRNVGGETVSDAGTLELVTPVKDAAQAITSEARGETSGPTESGQVKGLSDDKSQPADSFGDVILYMLLIIGLGSVIYLKQKELSLLGKRVYSGLLSPFKANNKLNKTIDSAIEEEIKKKRGQ
ncbi:MAG: hypothetical protein UT66_C0002G0011 [candidate division CPR2 bacterium GW2011_GWC1_39_9]|nr:MAG: hypothetical protein UT66_C0002G0011 [candidate division CPR2 bacterium GW2011_GWC1_39_9]